MIPDFSGQHAAPSYGLFLRNLYNSSFNGLTVSFDERDDRPALILENCVGVTFGRDVQLERGERGAFDVGLRSSTGVVLPQHLRACAYPYERCNLPDRVPLAVSSGEIESSKSADESGPVRIREVIDSGVVRVVSFSNPLRCL